MFIIMFVLYRGWITERSTRRVDNLSVDVLRPQPTQAN